LFQNSSISLHIWFLVPELLTVWKCGGLLSLRLLVPPLVPLTWIAAAFACVTAVDWACARRGSGRLQRRFGNISSLSRERPEDFSPPVHDSSNRFALEEILASFSFDLRRDFRFLLTTVGDRVIARPPAPPFPDSPAHANEALQKNLLIVTGIARGRIPRTKNWVGVWFGNR